MCGIFGINAGKESLVKLSWLRDATYNLFQLSETRGKEASGCAIKADGHIRVFKSPLPASEMIKDRSFNDFWATTFKNLTTEDDTIKCSVSIIGHSRLVTNGSQSFNFNNQPVIKEDIVGIHNGIITNDLELWDTFHDLHRSFDIDTEVLFALIQRFGVDNLKDAIKKSFSFIEGSASVAFFVSNRNELSLATNNGSIYYSTHHSKKINIFSSERFIQNTILSKLSLLESDKTICVNQLSAYSGLILNLDTFNQDYFSLPPYLSKDFGDLKKTNSISNKNSSIVDCSPTDKSLEINRKIFSNKNIENFIQDNNLAISKLKRCSKCILPETMPFIKFNDQGVCNYCLNYKKIELLGPSELEKVLSKYRSNNGNADSLVTFSGGRDSSYGLHLVKQELGMNPIAYTYDWGMVTDLARRNIARICGKLGVEHILISADIKRKRININKNINAWLKNPSLGTIPLFMAGDKQLFQYANNLSKKTETDLIFLFENMLETTNFKSGYCGIAPDHKKDKTYILNYKNKFKILFFYWTQYLKNPAYLNSSVLDTAEAFISYYFVKHDFCHLFNYLPWEENAIDRVLLDEYNWETSPDSKTTWRVGDGTAAFYNYIYYTVTGLTENDTFRSNQIREGMITRDEALKRALEENQPRIETMIWYFQTCGIDPFRTLQIINKIPKHYAD